MVSSGRKFRRLLHSSVLALAVIAHAGSQSSREKEVRVVLDDQVRAWNQGDIDGYMRGYWNSDSTTFVSGGTVTRGFREVTQRYHKRYGDKDAMGKLQFEGLEVRFLARTVALAHGVWRLHRVKDEPWGRFTLILELKPEGWRITHDHTSEGS